MELPSTGEPRDEEVPCESMAGSDAFVALYEGLRAKASELLQGEWGEGRPDPTSLVNQVVLRLAHDKTSERSTDPNYLFAAADKAMRRILVERARARKRLKRGGDWERVPVDDVLDGFERKNIETLDLLESLERLATRDERQAQMISMRCLHGMTDEEIATHFKVSISTVRNYIRYARAWLRRDLADYGEPPDT